MPEHQGTHQHSDDEAFILVKAAPRASKSRGVTVCCAGVDRSGAWVRLYPVSFRYLEQAQKFRRWDRIRYRWRLPRAAADARSESRRVDDRSIEVAGALPESDRNALVNRCAVRSVKRELDAGRSLALLKPEILDFWCVRRTAEDIAKEQASRAVLRAQGDMFTLSSTVPLEAIPYRFMYRYRDDDGIHEGACQDWETEATYQRRCREMGEPAAIDWMQERFGVEWPKKGIVLAMGTHRHHPGQWLINGIIRIDEVPQGQLL